MGKEVFIPKRNQIARAVSEKILTSTVFRNEIVNPENLDVARESLRERGLCIVANHPSSGDARIFRLVFGDALLRKKGIVAPVTAHQEKAYINTFSHWFAVDLRYIVTEETIKKAIEKGKPTPKINEGGKEFMDYAMKVLSKKGTVIIFPQATRSAVLNSPKTPPRVIGTLMAEAKRKNIDIAFLFVGIDLERDVDDYSKVKGYNFFQKYKLTIGNTLQFNELLEKAGGKFSGADSVVYEQLAFLVSPKYANAAEF